MKMVTAVCASLLTAELASAESKSAPFANITRVKEELWMLAPASDEKLRKIEKDLGSDDFSTRQKTRKRLIGAPKSWVPLLETLSEKSDDPEVRRSLSHVLDNMNPEGNTTVAELAHAALVHGHRSLAFEFLSALPSTLNRLSAEKVFAAARLSVTDDEKAAVVKLLSSEEAFVREGAVRVVAALMTDPRELLKPTLNDADGLVRLAALELFAAKADPACLDALAGMLTGEDFYLRWRAAGILHAITKGEVSVDFMQPTKAGKLDLNKWRVPDSLTAVKPGETFPSIPLFGVNEDLSSWTIARGALADIPELQWQDGYLSSRGTGLYTWASPMRFQNYRLRLDWRFDWQDSESNAGFSLAKFNGPPPEYFDGWTRGCPVEIEIRGGSTGTLYPTGTEMMVRGKKASGEVKIQHRHNERNADWNTLKIEERDGSLRIWVNGLLQNEANGLSNELTTFGLRSERAAIDWRNLMLEPLPGARVAPQLDRSDEKNEKETIGDDEQGDD